VSARDAYTSIYFQKNRAYAELFGNRWVVLSAKYGFVDPDFVIPGPYNVTFNDPASSPVSATTLYGQVRTQGLDQFEHVVGLGGSEYRALVQQAFAGTTVDVEFPFAGLPIGKAIQAADAAVRTKLARAPTGPTPSMRMPAGSRASGNWRDVMVASDAAGRLLLRDRELGEAEFDRLLAQYPHDGMLFLKRGEARAAAGDPEAAINDLVTAEHLLPMFRWKERARAARARLEAAAR
jgi:hypothetical protein